MLARSVGRYGKVLKGLWRCLDIGYNEDTQVTRTGVKLSL